MKETSEHLPILEWQVALQRLGGDMSFYLSLWEVFENNYADLHNQFTIAFEQYSNDEVKQFAHSIKGVAANLGATELMQLMREIEQHAVCSTGVSADYLEKILEVEQRLIGRVSELRGASSENLFSSHIDSRFPELKNALITGNTAVLDYVENLEQLASDRQDESYSELAALISDFEFEKALMLLNKKAS